MTDWSRWRANLRQHLCLRDASLTRYDFRRQSCGPSSFASVELSFEPSETFFFGSSCAWPEEVSAAEAAGLNEAIAAGVYDALQPNGDGPYVADGVAARCVAVEWESVGSSGLPALASLLWIGQHSLGSGLARDGVLELLAPKLAGAIVGSAVAIWAKVNPRPFSTGSQGFRPRGHND